MTYKVSTTSLGESDCKRLEAVLSSNVLLNTSPYNY